MTVYKGREGAVRLAGSVTAEVTAFEVNLSAALVDSTTMGDEWTFDESVHKSWDGSIDMFWDPADTGQGALAIGERIAVILYPRGTGVTTSNITGTVTVESIATIKADHAGLIARSVKFKGYGAPAFTGV